MTAEFEPYQPILPMGTILLFGEEIKDWEWYPYPSRSYWNKEKGGPVESLDNAETVISLIGQYGFNESLEAIDLTVGCRYPCQTCIRDSQVLSSTMSLEAAYKIIQSPGFNDLLPDWSICVGFAAEPSDNPDIMEILNLMLDASRDRHDGFSIIVISNYRKQREDILRQLMILTGNTGRMALTISLPLNRDSRIQDDFSGFKKRNADLFNDNIIIFDLRNPQWLEIENMGRVLPGAEDALMAEVEMFQIRGKGGLLLNPEGLWFFINTTKYEAHTPEIFTPVTAENATLIASKIGRMNQIFSVEYDEAKEYKKHAEATRNSFPPRIGF